MSAAQSGMSTPLTVTFYRQWLAFPFTKMDGRPDEIMVGVSPNGPGEGGNYEFSIEHVGTERGNHRPPIALQVNLFADSWRAFRDLPEFFDLLADLDESGSGARSQLDLDDLIPSLEAMGWNDITAQYANRHVHVFGCVTCGERRPMDPRPCQGRNANVCVAEGCYGQACVTWERSS